MPRINPYASETRATPEKTPTRPVLRPQRRWERTDSPAANGERRKFKKIHVDNGKVLLAVPYLITSLGLMVVLYTALDNLVLVAGVALTLVGYGIYMSNTLDLKLAALHSTPQKKPEIDYAKVEALRAEAAALAEEQQKKMQAIDELLGVRPDKKEANEK